MHLHYSYTGIYVFPVKLLVRNGNLKLPALYCDISTHKWGLDVEIPKLQPHSLQLLLSA